MRIERFKAGDERRADACYEILRATRAIDDPDVPLMSRRVFGVLLTTGWVGDPRESRVVADGRRLLTGYALTGTAGEAFARAAGAAGGLTEIQRAMDTGSISAERATGLLAGTERASAGYSLVSWTAPTPEEYLDQVAAINRALYDAPHDPSIEEPVWDAARVVATDRRIRRQGVRAYAGAARHDASGELGGLTQVEVGAESPEWAFQALTAVSRAHRGHRLGLRLKLAMLELLARQEPQVTYLLTSNSETNKHMISINSELGYYVLGRPARSWELPAARVKGTAQS